MDSVSVALCKEYLKRFGAIMHHNIDKGLLVAGKVERKFGGGKVIEPMKLVFGDRATFRVGKEEIPVEEITIRSAKNWLKNNLRFLNPEQHMEYQVELKEGSAELTDIFKRKGKFLGANDTSASVGYAPLTKLERVVLKTERWLNSRQFKKEFSCSGEDIKIMGTRKNDHMNLTIAMPFVDKFIASEEVYFKFKEEILENIKNFVKAMHENSSIEMNTLDLKGRGMGGIYLTVLGTSAEDADCGQVGRGNRINGIIPLNRPQGTEAAAGKNAQSHPGKIYNFLTHKIANEIYTQISGIKEVYVWLCSQIGRPINQPQVTSVQLILEPNTSLKSISLGIREVVDKELQNIQKLIKDLSAGKLAVC